MLKTFSSYNSPMLRFMIMFNSCLHNGWGTFSKCRAGLSYHLLPGLLMWECHHPRSLPYTFENEPIVNKALPEFFLCIFSSLTCLKKPVFSNWDLLRWKVPARLYWDLLTTGLRHRSQIMEGPSPMQKKI